MKTTWDYSDLADAYLKRPDYAPEAIASLLELSQVQEGERVCDIGAGVGHLTLHLVRAGYDVTAVEPNDAMRANGKERTSSYPNVRWVEATAEHTTLPEATCALVTFGSSFNVTDRQAALAETARILRAGGTFACMWNHRDLQDPVQVAVESIISRNIPDYDYGTRREDQTDAINESSLFGPVAHLSGRVLHAQNIDDYVEAWRSHATLQRQAGEHFQRVVGEIEAYLNSLNTRSITVPYTTRIWAAQKR